MNKKIISRGWIIGGFVAIIVAIILLFFIADFFTCTINLMDVGGDFECSQYFYFPGLIIGFFLLIILKIFNLSHHFVFIIESKIGLFVIGLFVLSLVFYFIIGAIIGWLVEKKKIRISLVFYILGIIILYFIISYLFYPGIFFSNR